MTHFSGEVEKAVCIYTGVDKGTELGSAVPAVSFPLSSSHEKKKKRFSGYQIGKIPPEALMLRMPLSTRQRILLGCSFWGKAGTTCTVTGQDLVV